MGNHAYFIIWRTPKTPHIPGDSVHYLHDFIFFLKTAVRDVRLCPAQRSSQRRYPVQMLARHDLEQYHRVNAGPSHPDLCREFSLCRWRISCKYRSSISRMEPTLKFRPQPLPETGVGDLNEGAGALPECAALQMGDAILGDYIVHITPAGGHRRPWV